MRLKTKRIVTDVPVSDDGAVITVKELKKTEISRIIDPCKDFFFKEKGATEEEASNRFFNLVEEMSQNHDFTKLFEIIDIFYNLFREMAVGWSGIEDEAGESLTFSSENIEKIIEFDEDGFICKFVIEALASISREKEKISKNCKAGSPGSSTLAEPAVTSAETLN